MLSLPAKAGEKQFLWALESGDHRLPLPDWIGNVLEMRVCQFISEHDNWESKIQKRSLTGKMLIRSQQQKYELWKLNLDQKLVFAKDEKVLVSEAKKVNKNCILLNLHLSAVPQELSVSAADGAKYRLLLLSGQPSKEVPSLPTQLDHPAPPNVIGEPVEEDDEEASDRESHPGQNDEMHAREMDEEQEMMEVDESEPEFAVLADSDDDIENFSGVQTIEQQSAVKKVKSFFQTSLGEIGIAPFDLAATTCGCGQHIIPQSIQAVTSYVPESIASHHHECNMGRDIEADRRGGIAESHQGSSPKPLCPEPQGHDVERPTQSCTRCRSDAELLSEHSACEATPVAQYSMHVFLQMPPSFLSSWCCMHCCTLYIYIHTQICIV